jgi:hypothetical protein
MMAIQCDRTIGMLYPYLDVSKSLYLQVALKLLKNIFWLLPWNEMEEQLCRGLYRQ